ADAGRPAPAPAGGQLVEPQDGRALRPRVRGAGRRGDAPDGGRADGVGGSGTFPPSNPSAERWGAAKWVTVEGRPRLRSRDGLTSPPRLRSLVAPWRRGTRR